MSLERLEKDIQKWGKDKGILTDEPKTTDRCLAQYFKTEEETQELFDAIVVDNLEELRDAIGDIIVTLIMQTSLWGVTLEECVQQAYDVIIKRTGKMIDGVFVKDE